MDRISENELRSLLRIVINAMPSVFVYVDRSGRVVFWNDNAQKMSELETNAVRGCEVAEVLPIVKPCIEVIRQAIETGRIQKECRVTGMVDGVAHTVKMTVYPHGVDEDSGGRGAVILADASPDVVSTKKTALEPADPVSRAGLTEQIAHEINNHLAGILQNIQVIRHRLVGDLPKNRLLAETCGTTFDAIRTYVNKRDIVPMIEAILDSGTRAAKTVTAEMRTNRPDDLK